MIINVSDKAKLCKSVELILEPSDYVSEYDAELKKVANKVDLKGYRKGKAPRSLVQMHFGKSILSDILAKKAQEHFLKYVEEHFNNVYQVPVPTSGLEENDIKPKDREKLYSISFVVAQTSDFEFAGIDKSDQYTQYVINVTDEMVNEALGRLLDHHATFVDADMLENEVGRVELEVLNQNLEHKAIGEIDRLMFPLENADPEYVRRELLGKKLGDRVTIDLKLLYPNQDENALKNFYMKHLKEPQDTIVEGDLSLVQNKVVPELDQDFIDKYYLEKGIKTPEELKDDIRKNIEVQYNQHLRGILYSDIRKKIMKDTTIELPEAFIREYMINKEYATSDSFDYAEVEKELKWIHLRGKLFERFNISSTEEEISQNLFMSIAREMTFVGKTRYDLAYQYYEKVKNDKYYREKAEEELNSMKLFEEIIKSVTLIEKKISVDEFEAMMKISKGENEDSSIESNSIS